MKSMKDLRAYVTGHLFPPKPSKLSFCVAREVGGDTGLSKGVGLISLGIKTAIDIFAELSASQRLRNEWISVAAKEIAG